MASKSRARRTGQTGRTAKGSTRRPKTEPRTNGYPGQGDSDVLERGDIFFFYRPDAEDHTPGGLLDVNRFHVVLRPEGKDLLRYITVGRKKLPEDGGDGRHWAFVDGVFREP